MVHFSVITIVIGPFQTGQRLTPARAAQRHAVTTAWCQAIHDWYPDFLSRTLFTPPVHFNRVSYQVENVSGLSVLVPQQASDQPPQAPPGIYPHAAPAPPPPGTNPHPTIPPPPTIPALPPVGLLFPPPPSTPAPVAVVQDNDVRNDACLQLLRKCLSVLGENHSEVMMVVCELEFRKFLDGETDPIHRAHCALFPRPSDMRARSDRSGDFDLLIVHRHYGLVTVEAKAVGADPSKVPSMDKALVKIVGRAVKQLNKEHVVVCHLVHDLTPNPLRVTRCLMLPYVTCQQLTQALATSPAVAQVSRMMACVVCVSSCAICVSSCVICVSSCVVYVSPCEICRHVSSVCRHVSSMCRHVSSVCRHVSSVCVCVVMCHLCVVMCHLCVCRHVSSVCRHVSSVCVSSCVICVSSCVICVCNLWCVAMCNLCVAMCNLCVVMCNLCVCRHV